MKEFDVSISRSSRELTGRERLIVKDTLNALGLDEATQDGSIDITPDFYAVLDVHNEYAKGDKDYQQLVIISTDSVKYSTSSRSFIEAFLSIADEMSGEDEIWTVEAYRVPSKNYTGKEFLSCSIK